MTRRQDAARNLLQTHHYLRNDDQRIDSLLRHRRVAAEALGRDLEGVERGHPFDASLGALIDALLALVDRHGDAPMLDRTLMQPALVISFGLRAIAWVAPLLRARRRLRDAAARALQLQLGGAVGSLSVRGERGTAVAARLADELGLARPPGAWHTQRDEWVGLGCEVGLLCGTLGKIGRDIALLSQAEIAELAEPGGDGRGGSSAMPQEHERGLGSWQAELAEWPGLFMAAHGSANALAQAAVGLTVDAERMRRNIDALDGLVFAEGVAMLLAPVLGKAGAQTLVERLSRRVHLEHRPLAALAREALASDPSLAAAVDNDALSAAFDAGAVARQADAIACSQWPALRRAAASLSTASFDHREQP